MHAKLFYLVPTLELSKFFSSLIPVAPLSWSRSIAVYPRSCRASS